jgi:X-Pro dipeptidyl-peptidase
MLSAPALLNSSRVIRMHWSKLSLGLVPALLLFVAHASAQERSVPVFKDGEAQVVPGFKDRKEWIRHDLFVETSFDSDEDGKPDRVHVAVTRPKQTDSPVSN